jgi:hypothetical protein
LAGRRVNNHPSAVIGESVYKRKLGARLECAPHTTDEAGEPHPRITNPRPAGYAWWTGGSEPQTQVAVSRRGDFRSSGWPPRSAC